MAQHLESKSTRSCSATLWITLYHWPQHQMSWILLFVKALCLVTDEMIRELWRWLILRRVFFFISYIQCLIWTDRETECVGMCRFSECLNEFQCALTIICRCSARRRLDETCYPYNSGTLYPAGQWWRSYSRLPYFKFSWCVGCT